MVPPELLSGVSRSHFHLAPHTLSPPPSLLGLHQDRGFSTGPLLPSFPLALAPSNPVFQNPTYPQPDSHHHHEVDDDDRDVSCIADALVSLEGSAVAVAGGLQVLLSIVAAAKRVPLTRAVGSLYGLQVNHQPGEGTRGIWQQDCRAGPQCWSGSNSECRMRRSWQSCRQEVGRVGKGSQRRGGAGQGVVPAEHKTPLCSHCWAPS